MTPPYDVPVIPKKADVLEAKVLLHIGAGTRRGAPMWQQQAHERMVTMELRQLVSDDEWVFPTMDESPDDHEFWMEEHFRLIVQWRVAALMEAQRADQR